MPDHVHHYVVSHSIMTPKHVAEGVAHDAYMNYHRARLQLEFGLDKIDQLRNYIVEERGNDFVITYRDGIDAGMPKIHARVSKETGEVSYQ